MYPVAFESGTRPGDPRTTRANGAGGDAETQGRGPATWVALLVLVAGCAGSPAPETGPAQAPAPPTPPEVPVDRPALDPATVLPEPGVETRGPESRIGLDVEHYDLSVDLTDPGSGRFEAVATLRLATGSDRGPGPIVLDFAGLAVDDVEVDGRRAAFRRRGPALEIDPPPDGGPREIRIAYGGEPADGLFFGEDANGDPAVFADNWPNRARWWFPSNDTPADKATVRFEVFAPPGYGVVANGRQAALEASGEERVRWVWESDPAAPIPTYTMVIGVARFEYREIGSAACGNAPVSAEAPDACVQVGVRALAGDGDYGAERFSRGADMVDFYTDLVGAYPYEKLLHVESSTRFGGMENSSVVFYGRGGWEGRRMGEGVIAHETAHQWFGDAVTPASWYQLWVSEGFASYFGPLYFRARDGEDVFRATMERIRGAVVDSDVVGQAIVDSSTNRLFELLNANNYQKGAWVLHMLRERLGEEAFLAGIRDYYRSHLHGTADTDDVRRALEAASGENLSGFFRQWVESPGVPRLRIEWRPEGDDLAVALRQTQPESWPTFALEVELEVRRADGRATRHTVSIAERAATAVIEGAGDAVQVIFDPGVRLLATAEVVGS